MKNEKLDWLKAVNERPKDAAAYIEWAQRLVDETDGWSHPYCASELLKRLRKAARVQTVEEADRDFAEAAIDYFMWGCRGMKWSIDAEAADMLREKAEACREARAREAAEKGGGE